MALEELGRRRIYSSFNPQGLGIIVPSILAFGTEEQKQRWAVPILRGEITAALGMSEPDAGSDLAGLRTRAARDGEGFVVNGQKVWTSGAHDADVILTFVRTDPDAPKHKGISVLLIPTDSPGLTRRPFGSFIEPDDLDFNEVFFDDVAVPAENLVGPLNDGWRVATGSLGHERAMLWLSFAERLDLLVTYGGDALDDHPSDGRSARPRLVRRNVIDAHALRLLGYRTLAKAGRASRAGAVDPEAPRFRSDPAWLAPSPRGVRARRPRPDQALRSVPPPPLRALRRQLVRPVPAELRRHHRGGTSQIQRNIVRRTASRLPR